MNKLLLSIAAGLLTSLAQAGSVYIEDLTWPEVRDLIANGKTTAIIYAGSTEQKGPHMAIGQHNFVARHVGGRIADSLGDALVFPIIPFAITGDPVAKSGHMRFPGSVSLSSEVFFAVARQVGLKDVQDLGRSQPIQDLDAEMLGPSATDVRRLRLARRRAAPYLQCAAGRQVGAREERG